MNPTELLETRITGAVRAVTGAGEPELVPQSRLSGPMPWVIAIMVAMTVIALAGGLALRNTAMSAQAGLEGGLTVQIVESRQSERNAQGERAVERLRSTPGVVAARLVPDEELDRLIEPWLGSDGGASSTMAIPIPALIDVQLSGRASEARVNEIKAALASVAPAARVDAQSSWLEPVYDAISSLQWLAIALVLLLTLALAAAVLMAARTALGTNRDTIEIVHLLGGTDGQIARVFQRSIGVDAAAGGLVGFVLALVVILFLGRRFAGLGAGLVEQGSLGSADVGLMQRLVGILGRTNHRFIVSKGPLADEYELPSNMWGDAQVPQTNVLPLVDLVITHGGNNTTTEAFHFGKPMILLPLFWDQYDNAQRVHELGYGRRLDTYGFADDELTGALETLLADTALAERMTANAAVIRGRNGTAKAADLIEALAR